MAGISSTEDEPLEALLQTSTANFRYLADIAGFGVVVVRDTLISYLNPWVATLLGRSQPEELYGQSILSLLESDEEREVLKARIVRTLRTGEPNRPRPFRMLRGDGTWVLVESQSFAVTLDGHKSVLAVVQDLSERERADAAHKQAQQAQLARIQAEEGMLEARTLQLATDLTLRHGAEGELICAFLQRLPELLLCDVAASLLLSKDAAALTVESVEPPGSSLQLGTVFPAQDALWERVVRHGQAVAIDDEAAASVASSFRAAVGMRSLLVVPIRTGEQVDRAVVIGTQRAGAFSNQHLQLLSRSCERIGFAVERARLNEQLRADEGRLRLLSKQLVAAQETERHQLARELHDEVGQILTALSLTLERSQRASDRDEQSATVSAAQDMLLELSTRVREISLTLHPTMLDDLGLLPTLRWYLDRFRLHTQVRVLLHARVEGRYASEVETAAYRIIQEALNNVARHAKVEEATIAVWESERTLCVQVEDHGVGFNLAQLSSMSTVGLSNMRERASLLGGSCTVDSAVGEGTRVKAEFPLLPRESPPPVS